MRRPPLVVGLVAIVAAAIVGLAISLGGRAPDGAPRETGDTAASGSRTPSQVAAPTAAVRPTEDGQPAGDGSGGGEPEGVDRGGAEELEEQREATEQRLEALRKAMAEGRFGIRQRIVRDTAPGWAGERIVNVGTDDWEPAIAADPRAPHLYILVTRYAELEGCQGRCPSPFIALEVSHDGGRTWSDGRPICVCRGVSGQFDPIIEVVPTNGHVYAVWMNDFNVVFSRSTDHGSTWSAPVSTYGNVAWNDKPTLTSSANGRDVYVSWNGPTGGDPWIAVSHDSGTTWSQTRVVESRRYYFAFDSTVTPDGTVVFSESSLTYTGPGAEAEGPVQHHAFVSRDRGATWTSVLVDQVELGEACVAEGCSSDFYNGHTSVSADAAGRLYFTYDGATAPGGEQRIWLRTSDDGGRTWSARVRLSDGSEIATSPALEATGAGDVRVWYMQTMSDDHDAWNVWFRRSTDRGATWTAPVRISDASSGADYKTPRGFLEVYGDYGELAITDSGRTIAVWGEGFSWTGPGGSWFNRTR